MTKKKHRWICEECRRMNEPEKRKCIYCGAPKKKTISQLEKILDIEFSKFIRSRDNHICITCGEHAREAGHYIPRSNRALRWDEKNVNAQCTKCNHYLSGNLAVYTMRLIDKYGIKTVNVLHAIAKETYKPTKEWLKERIAYYKEKNKNMLAPKTEL